MKKLIKKLICKIKGHDYPQTTFCAFTLSHCQRCGKEINNRTVNDLIRIPQAPRDYADEDWNQDHV